MKVNIKALAFTLGIVWGGGIFLAGLANLIWPGYGKACLEVIASIYPGYHAVPSFGQVIVGTLYGLVGGSVAGLVVGWLYNLFAGRTSGPVPE